MTTSPPVVLQGAQVPRVRNVPPFVSSAGTEAVDLAAQVGLVLDPWQQVALNWALGETKDGRWSAFEVGLIVPRQNGKGAVLEARELAGLFLFGENLILHSAHEFKTAQEAFLRVRQWVDNTDWLRKRVARIRTSHGDEGIELKSGARLRFVARSGGSGRGFSGDTIILDEAFNLPASAMAALLPTLSARPNPQLWYTSSAGMDASEQLRRVRDRGVKGDDKSLCYMEWSADPKCDFDDREAWALANPAMGGRISEEFIERERAAMPELEFGRERLGIWDDPKSQAVLDVDVWAAEADPLSEVLDPVAFAVDVTPDREWASIALAGRRRDGKTHAEVVERRRGTGWVVDRLQELRDRWKPAAIAVDVGASAGALVPRLEESGVEVLKIGTRDYGQACGGFFDLVMNGEDDGRGGVRRNFVHLDQPQLNDAVEAARKRPMGTEGAWAWHRRDSTDISPLVAVTLATYAFARSRAVVAEKPGPDISHVMYGFN